MANSLRSLGGPLEAPKRRLDQLEAGGVRLNNSPAVLLALLIGVDNLIPTPPEPVNDEEYKRTIAKNNQLQTALNAIFGDIIQHVAETKGEDFVTRAARGELTEDEISGEYRATLQELPEAQQSVLSDGVQRLVPRLPVTPSLGNDEFSRSAN